MLGTVNKNLVVLASTLISLPAVSAEDSLYELLNGGKGSGYCTFIQHENTQTASVYITNLTPKAAATIWIKANEEVIGQLGGGFSDSNGQLTITGTIPKTSASEVMLDVRDHERVFSEITDAQDLQTELTQPRSNDAASISTKMGTCSFELADTNTDRNQAKELYKNVATHTRYTWLELPVIPQGTKSIDITTDSGSGGDVSLYLKKGSQAQLHDYDYVSQNRGNTESITLTTSPGERYFALVHSESEYYSVNFTVWSYE